jgi:hypothetical protein
MFALGMSRKRLIERLANADNPVERTAARDQLDAVEEDILVGTLMGDMAKKLAEDKETPQ